MGKGKICIREIKVEMANQEKKYHLPISELIDRVTILEIKLVLDSKNTQSYLDELNLLKHDIQIELSDKSTALDLELIQTLISLGQINLHIWHIKDQMKTQIDKPIEYSENMKLAHQLNGLRNQLKNELLRLEGNTTTARVRSNIETDGLNINLGI
jgi:hypothetical protein